MTVTSNIIFQVVKVCIQIPHFPFWISLEKKKGKIYFKKISENKLIYQPLPLSHNSHFPFTRPALNPSKLTFLPFPLVPKKIYIYILRNIYA